MGDTTDVLRAPYDHNAIVGLGYQHYRWSLGYLLLGWEVGVAGRFGGNDSAEFWSGPTMRYDGFVLANLVRIAPSFTAGFSVVTASMGIERDRELAHHGSANILFYLGPEIAISTVAHPNIELFYQLHHRCGANGTLGELREGYNANVIGLRFRF
jgi:hypothetical protein